jgi:D-glutamate cyclase
MHGQSVIQFGGWPGLPSTHLLAVEAVGRATDGRYYSMRGRDITEHTLPVDADYLTLDPNWGGTTIGIGDGGNEIGMGKIPHETVIKNIPNGDLIHCRVPTDHLIVAGVSNWGAYALAAGVFVLRGVTPPPDLFDPDREREILEVMVREGPLVDGVTGKQTATVDGLTWDEYVKPLIRIRQILQS